jgi:hypothetical protein
VETLPDILVSVRANADDTKSYRPLQKAHPRATGSIHQLRHNSRHVSVPPGRELKIFELSRTERADSPSLTLPRFTIDSLRCHS